MPTLNVALVVGGFPSKEDTVKGIFNLRAAKSLANEVDLTVIHVRGWRPGRPLFKKEVFENISVIRLGLPKLPPKTKMLQKLNNFVGLRLSWFLLKNYLKNIDIIHTVYITYGGLFGSFWKQRLKTKVKHVSQAIGSDVNSQLSQHLEKNQLPSWCSEIDAILCNSQGLKKIVQKQFPLIKNIRVAYRGINPQRYKADSDTKQKNDKSNQFKIVFLGGFSLYTGLKYGQNTKGGISLMKAWELIEKKEGIDNVQLTLGGPDSDSDFVKNWINSLRHPERVRIIGYLPTSKVPEILLKSDLLVISSMEEGLPNLLLEASLLSIPTVASNVGGITEVIQDGENGFLVEAGDFENLNYKIQKAINNNDLESIGKKAKENVILNFDSNRFTSTVLEMYNALSKEDLVCAE